MAEPRWLDEEQQRAWRMYLAVTALLPVALDQQLQRDAGLSHPFFVVLIKLSEASGCALRMSELALRANVSPSRLSHTVARLEERGLVRRERASDDGRGNVAVLTDEGRQVVVEQAPGHVAAVRYYMFDALTPAQCRQFVEILRQVLDRLDPGHALRVSAA